MLRKIESHIVKELSLCLLSAILIILSFPRFDYEFLAWFGFVPLFFAIENKSKAKAFILSYLTGVIFWIGVIYWLVHVTFVGMAVLVLYLALYFAIFGLIVSTFHSQLSILNLFFIPAIWVILEYARSHVFTGFPWALLGYTQYLNLPIIQIADITGAWGVSFLVMIVNVGIYSVIGYRLSVIGKKRNYLVPMVFLIGVLIYGYNKLYRTPQTAHRRPIKISVIQGNISQELKWDPAAKNFIVDKYLSLSRQAVKDKPDLIIWPEAALPVVLEEEPLYFQRVRDFVKETNIALLLGAVSLRHNFYYNSALLVSGEGKLLSQYDKLHLVPFGEYIPLRKMWGFLETVVPIGDFTPGKSYTLFSQYVIRDTQCAPPFSVLICFEDLFAQISRQFVKKGANFLVNITNDAWFKKTSAPYQHLQASVFRAVENRVILLRSANTGISGFIAPSGKIISLIQDEMGRNIFIEGYKTKEILIPEKRLSFYTRYGDIFILALFIFVIYSILRLIQMNQTKKT